MDEISNKDGGCNKSAVPSASSVFLTATTRSLSSVSLRVCFLESDSISEEGTSLQDLQCCEVLLGETILLITPLVKVHATVV